MNIWVLLALLIIAALSLYAANLHLRLRRVKAQRKEEQAELEQTQREQRDHCQKSIFLIANALLADTDQITLTEAAIRISVLSRQLNLAETEQGSYAAFHQLSEATAHIPILDGWKKLDKKEKRQFDKERTAIEKNHREAILKSARSIVGKSSGNDDKPIFYDAGS